MKVLAFYASVVGAIVGLLAWTKPWELLPFSGPDGGSGQVVGVHDGDTLTLSGLGSVRIIGLNAPEVPPKPRQCYGREATRDLKRLVPPGTRLRYETGREPRDRYGRQLVYLWTKPKKGPPVFVNAALLRRGDGRRLSIPPNVAHGRELDRALRTARRHRRGMWGACR